LYKISLKGEIIISKKLKPGIFSYVIKELIPNSNDQLAGFGYEKDFVFKTSGYKQFSLDFANKEIFEKARIILQDVLLVQDK